MHLRRPLWQTITHETSALERERELAVKKGNNKKSATLYQSETEKRDEEKNTTRFTRQQQRSVSQLTQSRIKKKYMVRDETEFTGTKGDNDEDPSQGGSSYRLQDYKIERERNTVKKKSHHHSWLSCVYAFHAKGKKKK